MNEPRKPESQEPRTTVLHLDKFGPQPTAPVPLPAPADSPTIVIKRAAAQVSAQSPQPVLLPKDGGGALSPNEMLGAVSYAYAKGVYRSEDIERKMTQDPALRAALHDEIPDAHAIRRFRRLNHGAIQATLESFFRWVRRKPDTTASAIPPAAVSRPSTPEGTTITGAKKAAEARLNEAAFVDNMSKED